MQAKEDDFYQIMPMVRACEWKYGDDVAAVKRCAETGEEKGTVQMMQEGCKKLSGGKKDYDYCMRASGDEWQRRRETYD